MEANKKDIDTARAKEFLECLGHGKTIYQIESEEDDQEDDEQDIEIVEEEEPEDQDESDTDIEVDDNPIIKEIEEQDEEDDSRDVIRLSDGSREIFLSSKDSKMKDLKDLVLELLKEKDVREFLRLNHDHISNDHFG